MGYAWWGWVDNDMWVGRDLAELAGQLVRAGRCACGASCDGVSKSVRDLNAESMKIVDFQTSFDGNYQGFL